MNTIVNGGALELSGVDPFSSLPWDVRYRISTDASFAIHH